MPTILLLLLACGSPPEPEPLPGEWRCTKELAPVTELDTPIEGFDLTPANRLISATGQFADADARLILARPAEGLQHVDFSPEPFGGEPIIEPPVCRDSLFVFTTAVFSLDDLVIDANAGLTMIAQEDTTLRAAVTVFGGTSGGGTQLGTRLPTQFVMENTDTTEIVLTGTLQANNTWDLTLAWEGTTGIQTTQETVWTGQLLPSAIPTDSGDTGL